MKKIIGCCFILPLLTIGLTKFAQADNPPSGFSRVPHLYIADRLGADHSPYHFLLLDSAEIRNICGRKGRLWLHGDNTAFVCTAARGPGNGFLWIGLRPAPGPLQIAKGKDDDLRVLGTEPPRPSRWRQRPAAPSEIAALRSIHAKQPQTQKSVHSYGQGIITVETGVGVNYFLVPGRHLRDANDDEICATTSALLFVKVGQSISYSGELEARPSGYIDLGGKVPPLIEVSTQCGKMHAVWQALPKLTKVMDHQNGYEYGE